MPIKKQYKKTKEEAILEANLKLKKLNIKIVGFKEYVGTESLCHIFCEKHGLSQNWENPWTPKLKKISNIKGCLKCTKNYKKTKEELFIFVEKNLNKSLLNIIKFDEKFKGNNTLVYLKCKKHGECFLWDKPWIPKVVSLLTGTRCPKCAGNYRSTEQEKINYVNDLLKNKPFEILKIVDFKNEHSKCIMKCSLHGISSEWDSPWLPSINGLKSNIGCPKCAGNYRFTEKENSLLIKDILASKNIEFLGFKKYVYDNSLCLLKCKIHGKGELWNPPWTPKLNKIKSGQGCPKCAKESNDLSKCLINNKLFKNPRYLYYIKIKDLSNNIYYYKVGVTNSNNIGRRFTKKKLIQQNLIFEDIKYFKSYNILILFCEYYILRKYNEYNIFFHKMNIKGIKGATECFNKNILIDKTLEKIFYESLDNIDILFNDFNLNQNDIIYIKDIIKEFKEQINEQKIYQSK